MGVRRSGSCRFTYQPRNSHSGVHQTQVARHWPGTMRKSAFQRSQTASTSFHSPSSHGYGWSGTIGIDSFVGVPAGSQSETRSGPSPTMTIGFTSTMTGAYSPFSATSGMRWMTTSPGRKRAGSPSSGMGPVY